MFTLLTKIPKEINIAFSGGVDSLAVAHFLKRGKHKVTLLHFNHGCQYSDVIETKCLEYAKSLELPVIVGKMPDECESTGQSLENFWRRARYKFLRSFNERFITCHHLDDALEQSLISLLNTGVSTLIPVEDSLVLRPFLITPKKEFEQYALRHNLIPVHDEYNYDLSKRRNYIRANIMPHILNIQPGYHKVIRKRYIQERLVDNKIVVSLQ